VRLVFFVTDIANEKANYTTYRLAVTALARGHSVFHISASDFTIRHDEQVLLTARRVTKRAYKDSIAYFEELTNSPKVETLALSEIDALMLRSDPSLAVGNMAWAQTIGIQLGRLARRDGVIVLNDPEGLNMALTKMYLQMFPESVRPRTVITQSVDDIKAFAKTLKTDVILKPVQGSAGKGVFLLPKNDFANLNQIVKSLSKDGYIIAQEYLKEAEQGDTRLFLMNGEPLKYKGKYAAFRRLRKSDGDVRSNVHVGGTIAKADVTDEMLTIADALRPQLIKDGMFLVGLDLIGNKVIEINVFCPGGLKNAQKLEGVDFTKAVVEALEAKVRASSYYKAPWHRIQPAAL
jgi:glutathione synthase